MATVAELKKKAADLRRTLAKIDKATGVATTTPDAQRMAAKRAAQRDLSIPDPVDPERRERLGADDAEWLRFYLPDVFYNPFTRDQLETIAECGETLKFGSKKCKAAPRGDGKSSIIKYLVLKYALYRQVKFPLVIAATHGKAKKMTQSLRKRLASRRPSPLSEDFPLETTVAQYVDPWPSRARNVTANGQRSIYVEWGSDYFILPTWEDEEPIGPIIMSLGYTSDELQGCNIYDIRPDYVVLDDLDSRDSLASEDGVIAGKIEEVIEKTIAGLGGQSRQLGQYMICTITSREAAAYKYSDPSLKPAWSGTRVAAIQKWPEREDLWEEYINLRRTGLQTKDEEGVPIDRFGRRAHQFYIDHFDSMNAGAVVSNPANFETAKLPDGTQKQLSSLQRCYDYIADHGRESFDTEHQNDPPETEGLIESELTPYRIQRKVSGYDSGVIPSGCTVVVQGIDVKKNSLHWVVRAWSPNVIGYTIAYGVQEVRGTKRGTDEGVDTAIHAAILELWQVMMQNPMKDANGKEVQPQLTLIDARYRKDAIFQACKDIGSELMPAMGHGKSHGCVHANFYGVQKPSATRKPGDGWFLTKQGSIWVVNFDADHWKAYEHDRWMAEPQTPGSLQMYGIPGEHARMSDDERNHHSYAHHICNEREVEDVVRGVLKRFWKKRSSRAPQHWLDASAMSNVAASMSGVKLQSGEGLVVSTVGDRVRTIKATSRDKQQGWFERQRKK